MTIYVIGNEFSNTKVRLMRDCLCPWKYNEFFFHFIELEISNCGKTGIEFSKNLNLSPCAHKNKRAIYLAWLYKSRCDFSGSLFCTLIHFSTKHFYWVQRIEAEEKNAEQLPVSVISMVLAQLLESMKLTNTSGNVHFNPLLP